MKIHEFYQQKPLTISFEVFPPRTDELIAKLHLTLEELKALKPAFISVTFRPDRSSRDLTFELARRIKEDLGIESMAHFTCIGASREVIRRDLDLARDMGIENILALRGDPPPDQGEFPQGDFPHASDLVTFMRGHYDFGIGVAGYPEGHIECPDKQQDLEHLRLKVEAGGQFIITQLFFDNRYFYDFVQRARRIGIGVPIVPGLLPILNAAQVQRFAALCGATIPAELLAALDRFGDDQAALEQFSIDYATRQCADLIEHGVQGLHFYCLNRAHLVRAILRDLGRSP